MLAVHAVQWTGCWEERHGMQLAMQGPAWAVLPWGQVDLGTDLTWQHAGAKHDPTCMGTRRRLATATGHAHLSASRPSAK